MKLRQALAVLPVMFLAACIDDTGTLSGPGVEEQNLAQIEDGKALAEANCASCHAVGRSGASPNPKAPVFRTVLKRYSENMLRTELAEGMRVTHDPMPKFQFRPEAVDSLIAYLKSIEVKSAGETLVEQRCAKCHAVGMSDTSPYPGAQPFRNLGQRWRRDQLRQALLVGIIAEHDKADVRVPPMKLTATEADSFLEYLDSIATRESPAPR
jgi:mono/diheme cytochrome c family protein